MKLTAGVAISLGVLLSTGGVQQPLPYLTEGNVIEFYNSSSYTGEGRMHSDSYLRIKSSGTHNGLTRATAIMSYNDRGTPTTMYKMQFACDSLNFYAAAENWMYIPVEEYAGQVSTYTHDSVCYPLKMIIGDTLPLASVSRTTQSLYGTTTTTFEFMSRKVVALDTIITPFGKKACYQLTSTVKSTSTSPYAKESNGYVYELTEWFNATLGIVKTEIIYGEGNSTVVMKSPGR